MKFCKGSERFQSEIVQLSNFPILHFDSSLFQLITYHFFTLITHCLPNLNVRIFIQKTSIKITKYISDMFAI